LAPKLWPRCRASFAASRFSQPSFSLPAAILAFHPLSHPRVPRACSTATSHHYSFSFSAAFCFHAPSLAGCP
jgi:hypothetical protein